MSGLHMPIHSTDSLKKNIEKKDKLLAVLSEHGVNINQLKNHLRSNSVGGIGAFDY